MKNKLKTVIISCMVILVIACNPIDKKEKEVTITKAELMDKVKGGWAGQVIGCTYGGPTEFKWNGTMIGDRVPIAWDEKRMLWYYENDPGLYDDLYMDLTFVEVFEKYGLDAPDSLHALAFARADYHLYHANQAARYNILKGIMPPASGHWKNNPHSEDLDFQIEADFAGLMSPGMVNSASEICGRIGHIMNYGDGFYGGVYVAAMYALAYVHSDIEFVVNEALKTIPTESEFHQCISDVIKWHKQYPDDWKNTWFEAQKKWTVDKGCPIGVFNSYNIDAKINAAYIVIGLLYGQGDYGATIDISTRCGLDSDCNPANAAGILGTMIGYSHIPDYWKQGIDKVENLDFAHTNMSLNKVYEVSFRHATEMIKINGGREDANNLIVKYQTPTTVPLEIGFEGIFPIEKRKIEEQITSQNPELSIEIEGCGFVISGGAAKEINLPDAVLQVEVFVDGQLIETAKLPTQTLVSRYKDVTWSYDLPEGKHTIIIRALDILEGYRIDAGSLLVYSTIDPSKRVYY